MSETLKAAYRRAAEMRLVAVIECFDCGAPRGQRCRNARGREVIICCSQRAAFGQPIVAADLAFRWALGVDEQ